MENLPVGAFAASFVTLRRFGVSQRIQNHFSKNSLRAPSRRGSFALRAGVFLLDFSSSYFVGREVELQMVHAVVNVHVRPIWPDKPEGNATCDRYCQTVVAEMGRLSKQQIELLNHPSLEMTLDHANFCRKRLEYQNWVRQVKGLPADSTVVIPEPVISPYVDLPPLVSRTTSGKGATGWAKHLVKDQEEQEEAGESIKEEYV